MHSIRIGKTKLVVPNLALLPYRLQNGIKQFHLVAEPVEQTLMTGVTIRAWGYNGSTPGPVMLVNQGDRVQVVFTNRLSEDTSIHWHGLIVPNEIDGVPEIGAGPVVKPGETYIYDFVIRQCGTFMYHSHVMNAQQEMMGARWHDCLITSKSNCGSRIYYSASGVGYSDRSRHEHGRYEHLR